MWMKINIYSTYNVNSNDMQTVTVIVITALLNRTHTVQILVDKLS
jgi:hypothetical protein